ncbi:MAG: hypothetical protein OHK0052_07830 [Anaerolineales bacterium]
MFWITTLLFDLDGTLRYNQPSSNDFFFEHAVRMGAPDSPQARRNAARWAHAYWAQSAELEADFERFDDLTPEFWVHYTYRKLIMFGCPEDCAQSIAAPLRAYIDANYTPIDVVEPNAIRLLAHLRRHGYQLGLLTNRSQPVNAYLHEKGLDTAFDATLAAGEIGYWKPHPEIFLRLLEKMKTPPQRALYIGDNYYADVIGAQRAMLQPVLLDPENLFEDANCLRIKTITDLPKLLGITPFTPVEPAAQA